MLLLKVPELTAGAYASSERYWWSVAQKATYQSELDQLSAGKALASSHKLISLYPELEPPGSASVPLQVVGSRLGGSEHFPYALQKPVLPLQ